MPAKRKVSNIVSVPSPIGGWNVRDPLPSMEPIYALFLITVSAYLVKFKSAGVGKNGLRLMALAKQLLIMMLPLVKNY